MTSRPRETILMQLIINNQNRTLIPIQSFRTQWGLPDSFQMAYFESKEWEGLGSLDGAGPALATAKQHVIQAVPPEVPLTRLLSTVDDLSDVFRRQLEEANVQVGLRPVEIDFAVSGFYDVLQAVVYRLIELYHNHQEDLARIRHSFDFAGIYQIWLDNSVQVSTTTHIYEHEDIQFKVRIVYYIYGHIGLEVTVSDELFYVIDMSLACPASSYMYDLCSQVAQALCEAFAH